MKKIISKLKLIIGALALLPYRVIAKGNLGTAKTQLGIAADRAGTKEGNVDIVIGTIINAALTLVGLIFLILMVYAGYLWMTARGEEEQVKKAKGIISGSMIGLVIVLSAYAITYFVTTSFVAK